MANLYGYIRVSTKKQKKSGLSLSAQKKQIEECARSLKMRVAFVYNDAAVSASRVPLLRRKAGSQLDQVVQAGDHIVIAKLDRAFRSLQDFAAVLNRWQNRGILLHLLDLRVDTSSSVGRLIAGVVAAVAEWESRRMGERIREAHAERRSRGRKTNGTVAIGYRAVRKEVMPDRYEREVGRRILALRRRGERWRDIAAALNHRQVFRRRKKLRKRLWTDHSAMRWGVAAKHRFPITGYHGINADRVRSRSLSGKIHGKESYEQN